MLKSGFLEKKKYLFSIIDVDKLCSLKTASLGAILRMFYHLFFYVIDYLVF